MKLNNKIGIQISKQPISYDMAIKFMDKYVSSMKKNINNELLWFLEHDPIFTAGRSAKEIDAQIINKKLIRYSGRGGQWTWHGHGQRIIYVMLDLKKREKDIKKFVQNLENWIILTLKDYGIIGCSRDNFPGVWIKKIDKYYKIASIGIRISNWITFHGVSINLNPNLKYFEQIIPCGIKDSLVTSLYKEGVKTNFEEFDKKLINNFYLFF